MPDTSNNCSSGENITDMLFMAARTSKNVEEIEKLALGMSALTVKMEKLLADNSQVLVDSDLSFLGMRSEIAKFKHKAAKLKNVAQLYRGGL